MDKKCVICGAIFKAPPSSKKVTCSPECRSKRAALAAKASTGRKWSPEKKAKRASDPDVLKQMDGIQSVGMEAALKLPEGKKGTQNRASKLWILVDPDGRRHVAINLLQWARDNYDLFEPGSDDIDASVIRISSGFKAIASSMRGAPSRQRAVYHYKDWGLDRLPADVDRRCTDQKAVEAMDCYLNGMSVNATMEHTGLSYQKVTQILITADLMETEESRLFRGGKTIAEISEMLGKTIKSVSYRVPYSKGMYMRDNPTDNAKRIRKMREKRRNKND